MTTTQVSVETKEKLVKLGRKNQSYDSIICEMLESLNDLDKLNIKKEEIR